MSIFLYSALYLIYFALFVWVIFKWRFFEIEGTAKKHFAFFFSIKVAAGVFLTLIYTYYYTDQSKADIYRYFNDSRIISPLIFSHPMVWLKIMSGYGILEPAVFQYLIPTQYFSHPGSDFVTNNTFIIRVNVVLNYFSLSNIFINTLFLNFVSFIAVTALFKALRGYFSQFHQVLYLPLYLLPAVVFWSSGLLKESLLFTGVSLYLCGCLGDGRNSALRVLLVFIGGLILFLVKIQIGVLALVLFTVFLPWRKDSSKLWFKSIGLLLFSGPMIYLWGSHFCTILIEKRNEFVQLAMKENAGSYFDVQIIEPTVSNLLKLLPEALINGLLRPFLWDGGNLFQHFFAAENLFFLLIVVVPLRYTKRLTGETLVLAMCFFLFALANYLVIGVTVPIMGAIVHYRVIAAPFLLLSSLLVADLVKWKNVLGR